MKCPICLGGELRVITMMACSCGHHSLFCGSCSAIFSVPCGPPHGPSALPPDVTISQNRQMEQAHKVLEKVLEDAGDPEPVESMGAMLQRMLKEDPSQLPTIEEFKKTLSE